MEYETEVEISASRARVVAVFVDPEALPKWQDSLVAFEPIGEADPWAVGGKSKQLHRMGSREVEMVQTITARDDPAYYAATFEADKVWNLVENWFEDRGDSTVWKVRSEFRCEGLFMRAMCFLFPGMFKKQTREFMEKFKAYVEGQPAA